MSRTASFKIAITTALFGLLFTSPVSIGLVKAAYHFPHRSAITSLHIADQFQNARADRLALLIGNSNYPDADATMADVTAGTDALARYASGSGRLSGVSGQGVWSGRSAESRCAGVWIAQRN